MNVIILCMHFTRKERVLITLCISIFFLLYNTITNSFQPSKVSPTVIPSSLQSNYEKSRVKKVIDGDTIQLENGKKVRYIGIDTPETVDPRKQIQCYGKEASEKNKALVLGKEIYLEKDVSETDRYGRLLRYIYIKHDDTGKLEMINEKLVREGFAYASTYPPDVKHQKIFQAAEKDARENQRGLWQNCK